MTADNLYVQAKDTLTKWWAKTFHDELIRQSYFKDFISWDVALPVTYNPNYPREGLTPVENAIMDYLEYLKAHPKINREERRRRRHIYAEKWNVNRVELFREHFNAHILIMKMKGVNIPTATKLKPNPLVTGQVGNYSGVTITDNFIIAQTREREEQAC